MQNDLILEICIIYISLDFSYKCINMRASLMYRQVKVDLILFLYCNNLIITYSNLLIDCCWIFVKCFINLNFYGVTNYGWKKKSAVAVWSSISYTPTTFHSLNVSNIFCTFWCLSSIQICVWTKCFLISRTSFSVSLEMQAHWFSWTL